MKLGRLVYDKKSEGMSKRVFCNYGDNIQTIALDHILYELYPEEQIVNVNIYDLPLYSGEYILLPLNCNFWTCDENYFIPASNKIIPVFIAVSFQIPPTSQKAIEYLKKFEPIGCRDNETFRMMQELGIKSYINGCVSLTLEKRERIPQNGKVFLVDVPEKVYKELPPRIADRAEVITQIEYFDNDEDGECEKTDKNTLNLYRRYKEEAALVITSKLHCASPCIAMGIPVIVVRESRSCRFEWLNKFIKVYTTEEIDCIDWNPPVCELEEIKGKIRKLICSRVQEEFSKYKNMLEVSDFFEDSEKDALSVSEQIVLAMKNSGKKNYVIWGVGGYLGNAICEIIEKSFCGVRLVAAIDEFQECMFRGIHTQKKDALREIDNAYIFVATATGTPDAEAYMNSIGKQKGKDYFTFSMIN